MTQELQHAFGDAPLTIKDLYGKRVYEVRKDKLHKVGKVKNVVFHPTEKRVVGFLVKRPDAALMFHRKDVFVRWDGFELQEGEIVILPCDDATDKAACKRLGVDFDQCILWWNMQLATKDGKPFGYAEQVTFDSATGDVLFITADSGAAAGALLGKKEIPASMVRGFKRGLGTQNATDEQLAEDEQAYTGAILLDDAALAVEAQGGVAEKAGEATAVAAAKVRVVRKATKPKVEAAKQSAGEAAEKGLYATGRQLGRTKGMFANFKEEFDKARNSDD